jgi:hypothetical protein
MFVVGNPEIYQTNYILHGINTRQRNKLHIPSVKLSAIQKGVLYSSIKVFNDQFLIKLISKIIHLGFGMIYEGILQ